MSATSFVYCPACGKDWFNRDQFLADEAVSLVGYQANFINLEKGLFLFNHSCQGTLAIAVQEFADLSAGPIFTERLSRTSTCAGYCLHRNALQSCPNMCECAYVRDILQQLGGPGLEDA